MSCDYTTPSPNPLQVSRYRNLHADGRNLIRQWFDRAIAEQQAGNGSPLEAFIFLWFSFNGYASCVTAADRDAEIIRRVANCPDLRAKFKTLLANNPSFCATVNDFATSWPIFKVQDLRRLRLLNHGLTNRQEQVQHYLRQPGAAHEPGCFEYHMSRSEPTPVDWPHSLNAIYRVRSNLFHGEKSPTTDNDRRIVGQAFNVLSVFMQEARVLL